MKNQNQSKKIASLFSTGMAFRSFVSSDVQYELHKVLKAVLLMHGKLA
jgi:hypothetical protein